jgi:hypothetical protein
MTILTKEAILSAVDGKIETVEVPEWGGSVYVRTLGSDEGDEYQQSLIEGTGEDTRTNLKGCSARLAGLAICDDKGKRMFTDAEVKALGNKSSVAMNRVCEVAQRINGFGKAAREEIAKNLPPIPDSEPGSD